MTIQFVDNENIYDATITFKTVLLNILRHNESGSHIYELSHPTRTTNGWSGWAFGLPQYDISGGGTFQTNLLRTILENAIDDPDEVNALMFGAAQRDPNSLNSDQIDTINAALQSDYGRKRGNGVRSCLLPLM